MPEPTPSDVLLGNGYLGHALRNELKSEPLVAVHRRQRKAREANTAHRLIGADILTEAGVKSLAAESGSVYRHVYFMLPPSTFAEQDSSLVLQPLFELLKQRATQRVVLISSTGVYADAEASEITPSTPTPAGSARTTRLLAIEQAWLDSGLDIALLRLAGIYGPGRIIGRTSVLGGEALPGDPQAWLNLIHVADAARAAVAAASHPQTHLRLLISDGQPVRREDYYGELARLLACAPPHFDGQTARRGGSRRIQSQSSWQTLGIQPRFIGYQPTLLMLCAAESGAPTTLKAQE